MAPVIWQRFGSVPNYVEPFLGSAALLLAREDWAGKIETVSDKDGLLANFWRAIKADPEAVALAADDIVSEVDLHAWHRTLIDERQPLTEKLMHDPGYFDARIAGRWVWGISAWIGGGWCADSSITKKATPLTDTGTGVHKRLPSLGDGGRGVHRQLPHVGNAGRGVNRTGQGVLSGYFADLAARLRRVRICCGDWSRITGPSVTHKLGVTGIFLDPPYSAEAKRDPDLYTTEDLNVAQAVATWCKANGGNSSLRIALCGYEGEHDMPPDWEVYQWKTKGGYSVGRKHGEANQNHKREVVWFSPHCLKQQTLFNMTEVGE